MAQYPRLWGQEEVDAVDAHWGGRLPVRHHAQEARPAPVERDWQGWLALPSHCRRHLIEHADVR